MPTGNNTIGERWPRWAKVVTPLPRTIGQRLIGMPTGRVQKRSGRARPTRLQAHSIRSLNGSETAISLFPCPEPRAIRQPSRLPWRNYWESGHKSRMDSIHLEVRGRVQGVGFRWFVMRIARELGLAGWIRNRPDGIVELAAAGDALALTKLEAAVNAGPPGARVEEGRKLGAVAVDSLEVPFGITR